MARHSKDTAGKDSHGEVRGDLCKYFSSCGCWLNDRPSRGDWGNETRNITLHICLSFDLERLD